MEVHFNGHRFITLLDSFRKYLVDYWKVFFFFPFSLKMQAQNVLKILARLLMGRKHDILTQSSGAP